MVESLNLTTEDIVIEIGPGEGVLTRHLCDKQVKLIGIEVDERAVRFSAGTIW